MKAYFPLLLALPLWLTSCSNGLELMGERYTETDEFYLAGGESHIGDDAIEQARAEQWADQYGEFGDSEYDDPYAAYLGDRRSTQSRLWNRYTPGWTQGFGYSPFASSGFGYGGYNPYSPFGNTYGYNNMAFMPGYDAWGNPIGGFGNPFGFGNFGGGNWGYDPWGGGYWGTPGYGYMGGYGYGYNPYFGNMGGFNNPWGGFCGSADGANGGVSTFTPPRPRPNLGQFTGLGISGNGSQAGGSDGGAPVPDIEPAGNRRATRGYTEGKREDSGRRLPAYSPDRTEPQRDAIDTRPNRNSSGNSRFNRGSNSRPSQDITPSPSRGRDDFSSPSPRPSFNAPSSPRSGGSRPSGTRSGGGRSGRGG